MKNSGILPYIIPVLLLDLWQAASLIGIASPLFLPQPIAVFLALPNLIFNDHLLLDISVTLFRFVTGFTSSIVVGTSIGILMGYSKTFYRATEFTIEFFRSIPATALFPLFLLLFGIGDQAKFAIVTWGSGFIMLINTLYGVRLGKKLRVRVAKTMRLEGFELLRKVILPEALPQIFAGLRIAASFSFALVIVTEMFTGTNNGIGKRILDAQLSYQTADMYADIIIVGCIGFLIKKGIMASERNIFHWEGK